MVAKLDAYLPCGGRFIIEHSLRSLCIYLTVCFIFSILCKEAEDVIITDGMFVH